MRVVIDRLDKPRGLRAVRCAADDTVPLPDVPAVIGSGCSHIDLFPRAAAHVIDVEQLSAGCVVRIERDAEGVAESSRIDLLAIPGRCWLSRCWCVLIPFPVFVALMVLRIVILVVVLVMPPLRLPTLL